MSDIYNLILSHKPLDKNLFENIDVGRDGNCFYRTLSLFFTNEESHYKFFREQIYIACKNNLNELKEFFVDQNKDPILENNKLDGYIEKIRQNYFFASNIEISIASKIFQITIGIYEEDKNNKCFNAYAVFTTEPISKDYILINFENRNHYRLLRYKKINLNCNKLEKKNKDIINNTLKFRIIFILILY